MRISEVCTADVVCVAPSCTVREAAEIMRRDHVGSVVVVEADALRQVPIGLLTDRDIAISVVAPGVRTDVVTVGDMMSLPLYTFVESEDLFDAIRYMRDKGVRRLVITTRGGELAGILTLDDVYAALVTQMSDLKRVVEREQVREAALRS
jgi:CBS domain-containing protein